MQLIKRYIPKALVAVISLLIALPITSTFLSMVVPANSAELTLENKSNLRIETAEVNLCDARQHINKLSPSASASVQFVNPGECHYSISVVFEGGKSLAFELGYTSGGSDFKDHVIVEENQLVSSKPVIVPDEKYFANAGLTILSYAVIVLLLYNVTLLLLNFLRKR